MWVMYSTPHEYYNDSQWHKTWSLIDVLLMSASVFVSNVPRFWYQHDATNALTLLYIYIYKKKKPMLYKDPHDERSRNVQICAKLIKIYVPIYSSLTKVFWRKTGPCFRSNDKYELSIKFFFSPIARCNFFFNLLFYFLYIKTILFICLLGFFFNYQLLSLEEKLMWLII